MSAREVYVKPGAPTLYFDGADYYYDPQATARYERSTDGYTADGIFTGDGMVADILLAVEIVMKGSASQKGSRLKLMMKI